MEPHETFTWYDTPQEKRYIRAVITPTTSANVSVEYVDYPTKRNKRIAIRRALQMLGALAIVWGLVWMMM